MNEWLSKLASTPGRAAILAGTVALLTFANSLSNGFAYDDVHIIVENEAIHSLSTLPGAMNDPYWPGDRGADMGLWRPITTAVLGVQYSLFGEWAAPYHLINVLLHGAATALVTLLLATLMPIGAALIGGLVFAVHPVHVEAVSNVVGLAEVLPAVLFLGACLVARDRDDWSAAAWTATLYGGAFLSKESAVTLPAVILLLDAVRRPIGLGQIRGYLARRWRMYAALLVTAMAILWLRSGVLGQLADPNPALGAQILEEIPRIYTLGVVWMHYFRLLFFPLDLSVDYAPEIIPTLTVWTPEAVLGVGGVLVVLGLALGSMRGRPLGERDVSVKVIALATVWFLITILPVSNMLFLSGVLLAERTLYLPSVALGAVVGAGLWALGHRRPSLASGLLLTGLTTLAVRSWVRTPVWESTETVFTHLIADHPESGRSQWILGDIFYLEDRKDLAFRAYGRAIVALDGSYRLLMEVGWKAYTDGDHRLAEHLLTRAWKDRPELPMAPTRLAILYDRLDRPEDGRRAAEAALALDRTDVVTWHLLAGALTRLGLWEDAVRAREQVIALGEDPWQQWLSLANLRLTSADSSRALMALDSALARAPDDLVRDQIREAFSALSVPPGD